MIMTAVFKTSCILACLAMMDMNVIIQLKHGSFHIFQIDQFTMLTTIVNALLAGTEPLRPPCS